MRHANKLLGLIAVLASLAALYVGAYLANAPKESLPERAAVCLRGLQGGVLLRWQRLRTIFSTEANL
jgi:hypothetical protein